MGWLGWTRRGAGATAPGVTSDRIVLGMSGPFTGRVRELGRAVRIGLEACFRQVNDAGGVHGRALHLVAKDDGYDPDRAAANVRQLIEEGVFAFIGNVGTPTTEAALPIALEHKRVFFGAYTGAPVVRNDPPDRYVFNYRADYVEETAAIVGYLVKLRGLPADSIAVFAQNDGYGQAGMRGVGKALREHGIATEDILKVGYERDSENVDEAASTIARARGKVRAVVMVATYKPAAAFIQKVKDAVPSMAFTNVSFVGSQALAEELRERGRQYPAGVIVTQVVPHFSSRASGVIRYRENLKQYFSGEQPGFVSLEGHITGEIFVAGLKETGPHLTTEALVEGLERLRGLDPGIGVKVSYEPSDHQASHKVWGTMLDENGKFLPIDLD